MSGLKEVIYSLCILKLALSNEKLSVSLSIFVYLTFKFVFSPGLLRQ